MQILHDSEAGNRAGEAYAQAVMTTTKARAMRRALVALACAVIATAGGAAEPQPRAEGTRAATANRSGYAPIGPLRMYFEVHGSGSPVLLIHGAISTIDTSFGTLLPALAKKRRVVAIEQQGHGHTADIDRPLTFEQMADDAAALLRHVGIAKADAVGYSDGGNVAFALALRHPQVVRKLVVAGTNYNNDGLVPEIRQLIEAGARMPEADVVKDAPPQLRAAYVKVAPQPGNWPKLVSKIMKQGASFQGWTPEQIRSIAAPTLIVLADRDMVRPEHAVEMFRLLRHAQLAILPGRDHMTLVENGEALVPIVKTFLDAPMPHADR